jgi:putative tricarboxylic transport membrane protein
MGRVSIRDLALALGVVVLAVVIGWQTTKIGGGAIYAKVGPTVFPWMVSGMLAILGGFLVLHAVTGGWSHEEDPGDIDWPSLAWMTAALVSNVALIDLVGFIIASSVMFLLAARSFGSTKPVRDAAIGFALALVSYVGFDRVLGYKIGSGLIESLI